MPRPVVCGSRQSLQCHRGIARIEKTIILHSSFGESQIIRRRFLRFLDEPMQDDRRLVVKAQDEQRLSAGWEAMNLTRSSM